MRKLSRILSGIILISAVLLLFTSCKYMKMDPPPDVEKGPPVPTVPCEPGDDINDNSCWLATASNMLAGAGYGTGNTVQARAEEIYGEMVANFGKECGGWTDAALSWWLGSANNSWPANPYTIVTVHGFKDPKLPWPHSTGSQVIGNELRRCKFVGLSISWPVAGPQIGRNGHAITAWGDNLGNSDELSLNPTEVAVTDSDRDDGGNVQRWEYDDYSNPNPDGANEGAGWYLNYSVPHPYIKHIVTLCPTDDPSDGLLTQKVVGSYSIHQSREEDHANDLHYRAWTDVDILSYKTRIDWTDEVSPTITEANPRRSITVDWDLSEHPVPYCTDVIITTEFVLAEYNSINYNDVRFSYPDRFDPTIIERHRNPDLQWVVKTAEIPNADQIPNVTGGYFIASFDIINPKLSINEQRIGKYRLIHEYNYNQDPEYHEFALAGSEGFIIENLHFGHSYGYLSTEDLWKFRNWLPIVNDTVPDTSYYLNEEPFIVKVDWDNMLTYPEGEIMPDDIKKEILEKQK
jgi:hypothetical protein